MQIIKEVRLEQQNSDRTIPAICVIRTNCYSSQWSFLFKLVAAAKADFPDLQDEMIRVVHFAGRHYAGTFGIEFEPCSVVPSDYQAIRELELLR
jgi:hypothetical protein